MFSFDFFEILNIFLQNSLKQSIEAFSNRPKIFLLHFDDAYDVSLRKFFWQKYGLFMQNKSLHKISSFNKKKIHTAED